MMSMPCHGGIPCNVGPKSGDPSHRFSGGGVRGLSIFSGSQLLCNHHSFPQQHPSSYISLHVHHVLATLPSDHKSHLLRFISDPMSVPSRRLNPPLSPSAVLTLAARARELEPQVGCYNTHSKLRESWASRLLYCQSISRKIFDISNHRAIERITPKPPKLAQTFQHRNKPLPYDVERILIFRHGQNCDVEQLFLFLEVAASSSDPTTLELTAVEFDSEPFNFSYKFIC
jgi:hypothetical protein